MFDLQLDSGAASAIKCTLARKTPFAWLFLQQVRDMLLAKENRKFIASYVVLLLMAAILLTLTFSVTALSEGLNNFWGIYILGQSLSFLIAGLGLAIPISIIAFGLGWLQFFLIVSGQIEPHLTSEGFGSALRTIFGKFFEILKP